MSKELTVNKFNGTFGYWTPLGVALEDSQGNKRVIKMFAPPDAAIGEEVRINTAVFWLGEEPAYRLLTRGAKIVEVFTGDEVGVKLSDEAFRDAQEQLGFDRQAGHTTFLSFEPAERKSRKV